MKNKSTTRITIIIVLIVTAVVAYYAYLSNRAQEQKKSEAVMSAVDSAISRDLEFNYPSTPKEVIKYYNEIMKCYYNESCTDEQLEQLGLKARELYDEDLLTANNLGTYMEKLKADVADAKKNKRKITSASLASSTNVVEYTVDGFRFARIHCGYNFMENGNSKPTNLVYLLRKDSNKRWKIYGWQTKEEYEQYQNN